MRPTKTDELFADLAAITGTDEGSAVLLGVDAVERLAQRVLACRRVTVERDPVGFGNENWKLRGPGNGQYLLKVGERDNLSKWTSSHIAYELAAVVGVPVPELVHFGEFEDHQVRIFTWIDGHSAADVVSDSVQSGRLLQSVGDAVRKLHSLGRDRFSSRLDGSAPSFTAWKDYIDYRLGQIRQRCEVTQAVGSDLLDQACDIAQSLAAEVNQSAEAVLCHRDLHPDNLIVDDGGSLIGIVDWDTAEVWDRAGDWFKLEFELLKAHPNEEDILVAAYLDNGDQPRKWGERRRLVHLVESLNLLPNAVSQRWSTPFSDRGKAHLLDLVARSQKPR